MASMTYYAPNTTDGFWPDVVISYENSRFIVTAVDDSWFSYEVPFDWHFINEIMKYTQSIVNFICPVDQLYVLINDSAEEQIEKIKVANQLLF